MEGSKDKLIKHKSLVDLNDYEDINTIGHQLLCEVVMADEKETSSLILTDETKREMDLSKMYNDHPERAIIIELGDEVNGELNIGDLIYHSAPNPRMLLVKDKIMLVIQDYDVMGYRGKKTIS